MPDIQSDSPAAGDTQSITDLVTRNGISIKVRRASAADKQTLIDFFDHVSEEDRHFRFGGAVSNVAAYIDRMLAPDGVTTFLAFDDDNVLVASASLHDQPDGETAEVSLAVRADRKGQGISWTLLDHALAHAKTQGIKRVVSLESGDDRAAINLEREMGFVPRLLSADPIELSLSKVIGSD
jgi:acetyltransferase